MHHQYYIHGISSLWFWHSVWFWKCFMNWNSSSIFQHMRHHNLQLPEKSMVSQWYTALQLLEYILILSLTFSLKFHLLKSLGPKWIIVNKLLTQHLTTHLLFTNNCACPQSKTLNFPLPLQLSKPLDAFSITDTWELISKIQLTLLSPQPKNYDMDWDL